MPEPMKTAIDESDITIKIKKTDKANTVPSMEAKNVLKKFLMLFHLLSLEYRKKGGLKNPPLPLPHSNIHITGIRRA
jgi:hypothetical protein